MYEKLSNLDKNVIISVSTSLCAIVAVLCFLLCIMFTAKVEINPDIDVTLLLDVFHGVSNPDEALRIALLCSFTLNALSDIEGDGKDERQQARLCIFLFLW
jgi:hypothetical protein